MSFMKALRLPSIHIQGPDYYKLSNPPPSHVYQGFALVFTLYFVSILYFLLKQRDG